MSELSRPAEQALYSIRACGEDDGGDRERLMNACAATLERDLRAMLAQVQAVANAQRENIKEREGLIEHQSLFKDGVTTANENTEMRELLAQWVYGWDHMSEYPVGSTRDLLERTK